MGLKFAWSVYDHRKCCNNCIHCTINKKNGWDDENFYCTAKTLIFSNIKNYLNSTWCINHRFNKSFKKKIKLTKNKTVIVKVKQYMLCTVTQEYPHGN